MTRNCAQQAYVHTHTHTTVGSCSVSVYVIFYHFALITDQVQHQTARWVWAHRRGRNGKAVVFPPKICQSHKGDDSISPP